MTPKAKTSSRFLGPRGRVWDIIMPAETQVQMVDEVVIAGKLPGTSTGLGEIQFFVLATPEGRVVRTNEVIEYEHERRAVTRDANGQPSQHAGRDVA